MLKRSELQSAPMLFWGGSKGQKGQKQEAAAETPV